MWSIQKKAFAFICNEGFCLHNICHLLDDLLCGICVSFLQPMNAIVSANVGAVASISCALTAHGHPGFNTKVLFYMLSITFFHREQRLQMKSSYFDKEKDSELILFRTETILILRAQKISVGLSLSKACTLIIEFNKIFINL